MNDLLTKRKVTFSSKRVLIAILLLFIGLGGQETFAQNKSLITGVVSDTKQEPLVGVTIQIKGATTGTITDFDGKYHIEAAPSDVLVFSYIGYTSQSINVENKRTMNEIMQQAKMIEDNNWNNLECVTSIDLLLSSESYGSTKDKNLEKEFVNLKEKIEDINSLTTSLLSKLEEFN